MKKSSILMRKMLVLALAAMPLASYAQNLQEGWYQIKRSMSATELEKQLKEVSWTNFEKFFKNLIRNEYLYVGDEITAKQNFLGIEYGQRTYGAKYIVSNAEHTINTGDVNTYFYVTPVEGETEAYTVQSYNGHYLHSDGTFCVSPETLYLNKAFDVKAEATKSGIVAGILPGLINAAVGLMNIKGYSVGKASTSYDFDLSKLAGTIDGFTDPGFKVTTSYKEMSWQQKLTDGTDAEGNATVEYGEYMDGKKSDIGNIGINLAKDLISGELKFSTTNPISFIRFIMRNFCSDAYEFVKVDLTKVNGGNSSILGSIVGGIAQQKELIPYTVQIEGWDGTFKVNDARDYAALDLTKSNQLTQTNASVIIESDATIHKYEGAPIYNGGTIFAIKSKKLFGEGEEASFIDKGDHGCSNVVITPFDYNNGFFSIGANGVQDFSKCISAACVDEENHIIHVYFTEPGKEWKVKEINAGKFVTRNAPFALEIPETDKVIESWSIFGGTKYKNFTAVPYYATNVNGEEVELVQINDVIPAHTAVVIKNETDKNEKHTFTFKVASKDAQATAAPADNLLHGVCFGYTLDSDVNAYVLKTIDGKQKFYKLNQEDRTLAPWRAYLEWDGAAGSALRIAGFEEDVEGIDTVLAPEEENAPIYDLSGRRVNSSNGVTISAGKKYINK